MYKKYFEMVRCESLGYLKIIFILALKEFCGLVGGFFASPNIFDNLLE